MAAEMLPFATFSLLGGGKIEHSNIYDLWIMIYDLHFGHKGTIKKRDSQEKSTFFLYMSEDFRNFAAKFSTNGENKQSTGEVRAVVAA